eukprot:EG_transcript_31714
MPQPLHLLGPRVAEHARSKSVGPLVLLTHQDNYVWFLASNGWAVKSPGIGSSGFDSSRACRTNVFEYGFCKQHFPRVGGIRTSWHPGAENQTLITRRETFAPRVRHF